MKMKIKRKVNSIQSSNKLFYFMICIFVSVKIILLRSLSFTSILGYSVKFKSLSQYYKIFICKMIYLNFKSSKLLLSLSG